METVTDFIFGGSKITADGDCSHEIKGWMGPPGSIKGLLKTGGRMTSGTVCTFLQECLDSLVQRWSREKKE